MDSRTKAIKARIQIEGVFELVLAGRCMNPFLMLGDKVRIAPIAGVEEGLLYLIELPITSEIAVHRLVKLLDGKALCKGDRSGCCEIVSLEAFLGEVSAVKLNGMTGWCPIKTGKKSRQFIAKLSLLLIVEKKEIQIAPIRVVIRPLLLATLFIYSLYNRRKLKLKHLQESLTPPRLA